MIGRSIRVAIVEDQPLFRSLLASLVAGAAGFELAVACADVADARRRVPGSRPDVLLMDIGLPDGNGFGLARGLRAARPEIGVVLLSSHDMMDVLLQLPPEERAGWSYLSKTSATSTSVLLRALRTSAEGGSLLDPELLDRMLPRRETPLAQRTPRQFDALRHLAGGLSNAAIAHEMGITAHSVENLLNTVYTVLGVRDDVASNSRVTAALMLLRHGAVNESLT